MSERVDNGRPAGCQPRGRARRPGVGDFDLIGAWH